MNNVNPLYLLQEDGAWYATKRIIGAPFRAVGKIFRRPIMNDEERGTYNARTKNMQKMEKVIANTTNPLERARLMRMYGAANEEQDTMYKGRKYDFSNNVRVGRGWFG